MASNRPNNDGGGDLTTHHLIALHEPPESLTALRNELAFHPDLVSKIYDQPTFETVLAALCTQLDIVVDGLYDVGPLCSMLVSALRNRRFNPGSPHLRADGLVDVELIEKEGSVELVKRDRSIETVAPKEGAVVVDTSPPSLVVE